MTRILYLLWAAVMAYGVFLAFVENDSYDTVGHMAFVVYAGWLTLCLYDGVLHGGRRLLPPIGGAFGWALAVSAAAVLCVAAVKVFGRPHGTPGMYVQSALGILCLQVLFLRWSKASQQAAQKQSL